MLEFIILMLILSLLQSIPVGKRTVHTFDPYDNGTEDKFILDNAWEFDNLDDCMEYRELRKTGWKGDAEDFYRWRDEE